MDVRRVCALERILEGAIRSPAFCRGTFGITVILSMRFHFDVRKSERLRANPKRGIGFEEAREIFA